MHHPACGRPIPLEAVHLDCRHLPFMASHRIRISISLEIPAVLWTCIRLSIQMREPIPGARSSARSHRGWRTLDSTLVYTDSSMGLILPVVTSPARYILGLGWDVPGSRFYYLQKLYWYLIEIALYNNDCLSYPIMDIAINIALCT
jgi:hypothetical protein